MSDQFHNLLVVDDEASMRHMLRLVLEQNNYRVTEAQNGAEAINLLYKEKFNFVLSDIRMPDMDGLTFLDQPEVRSLDDTTIIMMSAYGSIDTALECMKRGAYDYISKPFKPDEVVLTLRKAEERSVLKQENQELKKALTKQHKSFSIKDIVHSSAKMGKVLKLVEIAAKADSPVLITGETGTGKELIAKALHSESGRKGQFLAINCSAITSGLLESELFGHKRGFTGADRDKEGLFSIASSGTLFLDEIAELPLELQPKLLRVLQEGEIRKVGATQSEKINTRVVAAAGKNLHEAVNNNQFRSDLYYRLAVVDVNLPPLRHRPEDILILADYFLARLCEREGRPKPRIREEYQQNLINYHWPGKCPRTGKLPGKGPDLQPRRTIGAAAAENSSSDTWHV